MAKCKVVVECTVEGPKEDLEQLQSIEVSKLVSVMLNSGKNHKAKVVLSGKGE